MNNSVQSSMFEETIGPKSPRPPQAIGLRRGSRSRGGAPSGPPPLFEGQTAAVKAAPAARQTGEPAATGTPGTTAPAASTPTWFPTEQAAVLSHLSAYKGVGRKTAEQLLEAFGVDGVYAALSGQQKRVRDLLGQRRGDTLLAAFDAERAANDSAAPAAGAAQPATKAAAKKSAAKKTAAKKGGAKRPARKTASKAAGSAATGGQPSGSDTPAKKSARKTARKSGRGGTRSPTK